MGVLFGSKFIRFLIYFGSTIKSERVTPSSSIDLEIRFGFNSLRKKKANPIPIALKTSHVPNFNSQTQSPIHNLTSTKPTLTQPQPNLILAVPPLVHVAATHQHYQHSLTLQYSLWKQPTSHNHSLFLACPHQNSTLSFLSQIRQRPELAIDSSHMVSQLQSLFASTFSCLFCLKFFDLDTFVVYYIVVATTIYNNLFVMY